MYVRMHVWKYVCKYVRMHLCIQVRIKSASTMLWHRKQNVGTAVAIKSKIIVEDT
jgi:hypothetical protein